MSERITVRNVRLAFEAVVQWAKAAGIPDTDQWVLQEGNYCAAYRLFYTPPGESGLYSLQWGGHNGFLGNTAREAHATLRAYSAAFWAVAELKRNNS